MIRFSPRQPTSIWSAVNIKRAEELAKEGLMRPAGKKAIELRKENRSEIYSYEQRIPTLPEPYEKTLKENKAAWEFFEAQPPSYRKMVAWWVVAREGRNQAQEAFQACPGLVAIETAYVVIGIFEY